MSKRDITDWSQKGGSKVLTPSGPTRTQKVKETAGKAGLLMCAAAIVAVLAKGVRAGGLEEYQDGEYQDKDAEEEERE